MEILRREGGALAHTDCFMVSGSKVLEGVGRYVVVAVGTKSFNGRIMMGLFFIHMLLLGINLFRD
jgi:P-type Ca2+ transporter type 2C